MTPQEIMNHHEVEGDYILFNHDEESLSMTGSVNTPDITDFFATIFRCSPGLKQIMEDAIELSEISN